MPNLWLRAVDYGIIGFAEKYGLWLLRLALGIIFIWFGALKVLGISPAAELVASVLTFVPAHTAVLSLGILEIAIGVGLITGLAARLTLLLFALQMAGTFVVLVLKPELSFQQGNPFALTMTGEFVVKNLVLLTAGFAVAAQIPKTRPGEGLFGMLRRNQPLIRPPRAHRHR
ncbi:MAG TPA: DoxX family membrane protein [Candidatus Tumulicola sp.]|nr:DoxX family membrane protein [Candidatus Tumulicola sp.]